MRSWLLCIALAGCHHASSESPDAPPPIDGTPDGVSDTLACTPTAATGQVTVDGPTGGASLVVTFIVHDPSGAVLSRSAPAASDATAMLDVPSCGMVTVAASDDTNHPNLMTWTNVQPGDHLVSLGREAATVPRDVAINYGGFFQATEYDVISSCAPNHLSFSSRPDVTPLDFSAACTANPATISVIAVAKAPKTSGYAVTSVPIATTGMTTVTMPPLDAATSSTLTLYHASKFATARYGTFASPAGSQLPIGDVQTAVSGDTATLANAPVLQGQGAIEIDAGDTTHVTRLLRALPKLPATTELDGNELLALVDGSVDTATTRPTVVWGSDAPIDADAALIELTQGTIEWDLASPAVPGSVRFPDVPADLWPATAAKLAGVAIFESSAIATFDAGNITTLWFEFPKPGTDVRASTLSNSATFQPLRFARASSD